MEKQIRIGETTLTVENAYAYLYHYGEGKEVLRLEVLREHHGYAEIEAALEHPAADIEYMENGEVVTVFKGYRRDFKCNYADGRYSVEITRVSALELRVEELEAKVAAYGAQ